MFANTKFRHLEHKVLLYTQQYFWNSISCVGHIPQAFCQPGCRAEVPHVQKIQAVTSIAANCHCCQLPAALSNFLWVFNHVSIMQCNVLTSPPCKYICIIYYNNIIHIYVYYSIYLYMYIYKLPCLISISMHTEQNPVKHENTKYILAQYLLKSVNERPGLKVVVRTHGTSSSILVQCFITQLLGKLPPKPTGWYCLLSFVAPVQSSLRINECHKKCFAFNYSESV